MLRLIIDAEDEVWDQEKEEFLDSPKIVVDLEHSLVSLSKWEQKFEKPFLGDGEKTEEEILEYIKFMILSPDFPPEAFSRLTQDHLEQINTYVNARSTATWIKEGPKRHSPEVITSELIYYWMISFSIPFECQYWHFNRLLMLIQVCNEKNQKPKKQSRSEMLAERRRLNAERRARYNTTG